jgi:hypothetical protein
MPSPTQQPYEDSRLTPIVPILQYHSGVVGADMKHQPRENPKEPHEECPQKFMPVRLLPREDRPVSEN